MSKRIHFKILNLKKPVNCSFGNLLLEILQSTEVKVFLAKALRSQKILTSFKLDVRRCLTYLQRCVFRIFKWTINRSYWQAGIQHCWNSVYFFFSHFPHWRIGLVFLLRYLGELRSRDEIFHCRSLCLLPLKKNMNNTALGA
jgi:hypothetical protein